MESPYIRLSRMPATPIRAHTGVRFLALRGVPLLPDLLNALQEPGPSGNRVWQSDSATAMGR